MLKAVQPVCEYQIYPLGIGEARPRIGWRLESDARGVLQTAYEVEVSERPDFGAIVWQSGRVESDRSVLVELAGFEAESCKRYYYRVRVWSGNGEASDWSETAWWENGLLSPEEWRAQWIAAPESVIPADSEQLPCLRRDFAVKGPVGRARLYATAHGLYELELNGVRVGDSWFAPGWTSYRTRLQVQTYDVTGLLTEGDNAIGALLGNGWFKGNLAWKDQRNIYGDKQALLLELRIEYADGTEQWVGTDDRWTVSGSPILFSELYHGETYDATLEQPGWSAAGFDDSGWASAEIREIGYANLIPQENEPVRIIDELSPLALITTPSGEKVIDMGQNMVGWLQFTVVGAAGTRVSVDHAEVLDADGNFYIANMRSARNNNVYVLKGEGRETFAPRFSFQGFRYARLNGFAENIDLADFKGVVLHSDMTATGTFACSDPLVNQLQHNIEWGLKGNFLDVPTDCPQRDERLGWTGDAQMFIRTAAYLRRVGPFFAKWTRDLAADQREDGGVPFVIPQALGENDHSSAAWGDAAVICPWTIYLSYGDKRILERQFSSMTAWIEYIRRQGDNEYLWNTGFHFGDWLGLDSKPDTYIGATNRDLIATAFYAYSTSLVRKSAAVLGKTEEEKRYADLYDNVVRAFREEFVTPTGRLAVDTQTAHVLALQFDLLEGRAKERAIVRLGELLQESKDHLTTGFVGAPYLNLALSANGRNDLAYKLLFRQDYPSWLYQVTKGATTIWEHWDGIKPDGTFWSADMNSFNHYAYGAIGDWLYRHVAGIDTDEREPGYKKISIRPQPGEGLSWAEGRLDTGYGEVRSRWSKSEDGGMELQVTIPANTTATVELPGAAADGVTESGTALAAAAGVGSVAATAGGVILTAGSGAYTFNWKV